MPRRMSDRTFQPVVGLSLCCPYCDVRSWGASPLLLHMVEEHHGACISWTHAAHQVREVIAAHAAALVRQLEDRMEHERAARLARAPRGPAANTPLPRSGAGHTPANPTAIAAGDRGDRGSMADGRPRAIRSGARPGLRAAVGG